MGVKRRGEASDGLQSRLLIFILLRGLTRPWAILVKMTSVIPAPAGIQGARAAHAVWGWDGTPLAFILLHGLTRPWAILVKMTSVIPAPAGIQGARAAHAVWGWDGTPLAFIPLHGLTRPWAIAAKAGTSHPLGLTGQWLIISSGAQRSREISRTASCRGTLRVPPWGSPWH